MSAHPQDRTLLLALAIECRSHQPRHRSSPLRMDALDPAQPEDPSECPPSGTPALLLPTDFLESPGRATQVSQDAGAGPEQSDDDPDNAATFHGAHG